jgi:ABC-type nitrate/sulfonate/bicarbonate transport system substrate-binding protein
MPEEKNESFLKGKTGIAVIVAVIIVIAAIAAIFIFQSNPAGTNVAPAAQSATGSSTAAAPVTAATAKPLYVIKQSYVGSNGASGSVAEIIDIADKLGYLKEEGIELQDVGGIGTSSADKVAALSTKQIDVLHLAVPAGVAAIGAGVKAKYIAPLMTTTAKQPDGTIVSTGGLLVRKGSALHTPKDFIGKTIGMTGRGSSTDYFLQEWFSQNGVDIKKVNIVVVPSATQVQALKAGQVDGVWMFSSTYFDAQKDPSIEVAIEDSSVVGSRLHCGYLVRDEFIQNHPDIAAGLTRALVKTWNWESDHPKELQDVAAEVLKDHKLDPGLAKSVYAWQLPGGVIRDDDAQFWIDKLTASGQLKTKLTPADIFTNQFNPNYNATAKGA